MAFAGVDNDGDWLFHCGSMTSGCCDWLFQSGLMTSGWWNTLGQP